MGNGASIFLSADLSKNLSDKSIRTFQEFENECIARNLNAEQIYDLLVNKYEELLDFDSHKKVDPKPEERPETVSSTKSTSQKSKRPQPKASWGSANAHAKKKLEKRSEVNTYYSKLSQKSKPKLQSSDSNRSLSTLRGRMDGTELNTISEELYGLNRADSLELGDDETVCMTAIEAINCELTTCSAKTDTSTTQNLLLPSEEYECKLCRKSFNSRHRLDRHLRFSEIHRQTLISLKERFFDDANGLDNLAKKAITHFQDSFKASFSYLDGDLNLNRLRWKKAIGKVVSRFIARKYETFVSQLHHSQLHPPLMDDKINLLHTDHKFFWRSKSRFLFHFYFHEMYDCIEIIPQLLPSTGMLALDQQQKLNMEGNSISNRSDSVDSSMNFTSATFNDVKLDPSKISPRFYINRRTIQKILLQQKEHSLSEEEEEAEAAAKRTENTNNPEAITIPLPTITDMEICKFLLSKLKIDNQLLENKLTIEKAIYFDSNHMMKNIQQLITINTVIPHGLRPMNIEGLKLYDGWEIQTKLQEIQSTHEELNRAVDKADQFSKSVKLFSPSNLLARFSPYLSPKKRFNANKFNLVVSPTAGTAK